MSSVFGLVTSFLYLECIEMEKDTFPLMNLDLDEEIHPEVEVNRTQVKNYVHLGSSRFKRSQNGRLWFRLLLFF